MHQSCGRSTFTYAFGLTVFLFVGACSSPGNVAPVPPSSTSVTPAPSDTPSPPTTTSAETTTTATPVPSATTRARAESDLSLALLDTYAFNAGVHVVTTPTDGAGQSSSGG